MSGERRDNEVTVIYELPGQRYAVIDVGPNSSARVTASGIDLLSAETLAYQRAKHGIAVQWLGASALKERKAVRAKLSMEDTKWLR